MIARGDLDVAEDLALGHYTHEKNPVLAAAALAALDVIEADALVERAARLGAYALARLEEMARTRPLIGEVRGAGLLIGIDLVEPDGGPAIQAAERVLYAALRRGLAFKTTMGNVLTLSPPLVIAREDLDRAIDILLESIDAVSEPAAV